MLPGMNAAMMVGGGGAFPVVQGTAVSTSSGTTATISLPSSIPSGALIIIELAIDLAALVTNWDVTKDFTPFFNTAVTANIRLMKAYRISNGTEGATVDVTIGTSEVTSHLAYHISGAASTAPEATGAQASGGNADPPTHTPSWGAKKTLWLASAATEIVTTSDPANYTDGIGTGASGVFIRSLQQNLVALSDDPGSFTIASGRWVAGTTSVQPA